jgi:6-pyruvoyltetrahydropterin/6-carboxytetrahydropterin synthase
MVQVEVSCGEVDDLGMAIDFRDVKAAVNGVLERLDHADLNVLPAFRDMNPTSEMVARHIYRELAAKLNTGRVKLEKVTLDETPSYGVSYSEE